MLFDPKDFGNGIPPGFSGVSHIHIQELFIALADCYSIAAGFPDIRGLHSSFSGQVEDFLTVFLLGWILSSVLFL